MYTNICPTSGLYFTHVYLQLITKTKKTNVQNKWLINIIHSLNTRVYNTYKNILCSNLKSSKGKTVVRRPFDCFPTTIPTRILLGNRQIQYNRHFAKYHYQVRILPYSLH